MHWQTKSFLQRQLSKLPFTNRLYFQVQKHFGGFKHFSINSKIDQGITLLTVMSKNSISPKDKHTAEIGTGWVPIVPMLFTYMGAADCATCDVNHLLDEKLTMEAAEQFPEVRPYLQEKLNWLRDENSFTDIGFFSGPINKDSLLRKLNIIYMVDPNNPLKDIESGSIDIFFSNDTLEHIPSEQLPRLFTEIRRVLKPNGLMIHQVDCSDHYSHSDPSINRINFLRFNAEQWAHYNNSYLFQNRLRASDYREIITSSGFSIDFWERKLNQRSLEELPGFPLAKEFQVYAPEDLCISDFVVLARPIPTYD